MSRTRSTQAPWATSASRSSARPHSTPSTALDRCAAPVASGRSGALPLQIGRDDQAVGTSGSRQRQAGQCIMVAAEQPGRRVQDPGRV